MSQRDPYGHGRSAMRVHRAELRRRQVLRRRIGAVAVLAVVLVAGGRAMAALVSGGGDGSPPAAAQTTGGHDPKSTPSSTEPTTGGSTTTAPAAPTGDVTISAVGDTMLGYAGSLAPSPGTYFDAVRPAIRADVAFANLEGTLTDQTSGKCESLAPGTCFEFRVPPSFARYLKDAGFTMISNANNHAFDFWQAGLDDTVAALDAVGLDHTGRTTEITYVTVRGIRLAFIGAGPYPNTGPLNDYTAIRRLVETADRHAQVVVVAMHAGAEGSAATHLTGRDEIYFDENRGNPEAFAHTVIDAGADLVLGSGPHVLRGMEFYRGRLIAYSLGDFAGYHNFTTDGALGVTAILRVRLDQDGRFVRGRLVSVRLVGAGQPVLDPTGAGAAMVAQLSREDLGRTAARIAADGTIRRR